MGHRLQIGASIGSKNRRKQQRMVFTEILFIFILKILPNPDGNEKVHSCFAHH